jgi:hypothetical protein
MKKPDVFLLFLWYTDSHENIPKAQQIAGLQVKVSNPLQWLEEVLP